VRLLVHDGTGTLAPHRSLITELTARGPLFGLAAPDTDPHAGLTASGLVEQRAVGYAREVQAAGLDDVEIVGYCLGGPVALELARALGEAGVTVRRLTLVSSHRVPDPPHDELVLDYAFTRAMGADPAALGWPEDETAVGRALAAAPAGSPGALGQVTGDEALESVAERFRALGQRDTAERRAELHQALAAADPAHGGPERIAALHTAFARTVEAVARYEPEPYAGDITFLRPAGPGPLLPGPRDDTADFWREVCLGDLTVVDIPGDHFGCLRPPHVTRTAAAIATPEADAR
jgi:pyochelin synthetase